MQYVIYVSKRALKTKEKDVDEIYDVAERANTINGITGVLLVQNHYFLQYFEGGNKAVDQLLVNLINDDRHFELKVLDSGLIEQRLFPDWHMAPVYSATQHEIFTNVLNSCSIPSLRRIFQDYILNESPISVAYQ